MTLRIISPAEILFEGKVISVSLPGAMGAFTVLKNHASLISSLTAGDVTYSQDNGKEDTSPEKIRISGGIAVVENNIISVCVD